MQGNDILHDNTYRVFVPIEDSDLMKSVEVDENGDYIVQGVMSSDAKDEEDDSISPEGMDCSYFLDKGWIKYEHGNNPNQFIGEPLEVKVGQFEHPTKHELVKGVYVKGRLFAQRELSKQAVRALQDLQKSNTKRKMGWSIEGNVKERDRKTGKIVKSILRNVVLTMNPVNTLTWAELAKSFAKNHELTIDMDMEKAMDTGSIDAINGQSIEGYTPPKEPEDDQEKWLKLFRKFVSENLLNKSLRTQFVASDPIDIGMTAYAYALGQELDNEDAYTFASYIEKNEQVLKSLFRAKFGGETMKDIGSILDTDLEALKKSLEIDEEEELEKSVDTDKDEDGEEGKDEDGEEGDDEDEEEGEEEGDDKSEKTEKALKTEFAKSLASYEGNGKAFEVSDFLTSIADEIGFNMDGFAKSMSHVTKQQNAIVGALVGFGELMKSLTEKVEDLHTENTELKKSLDEALNRPVGRKSVVNNREVATISKSINTDKAVYNRAQIGDILMKSFEAGEIPGSAVARFEAGVDIQGLNLPKGVLEKIGY